MKLMPVLLSTPRDSEHGITETPCRIDVKASRCDLDFGITVPLLSETEPYDYPVYIAPLIFLFLL